MGDDDAADAVDEVLVVVPPDDSVDVPMPFDVPFPESPPPSPSPPPPELPLSNEKEHCFTSFTSGCPSSVMGVKVILHVSVAGPKGVIVCCTVVTVT